MRCDGESEARGIDVQEDEVVCCVMVGIGSLRGKNGSAKQT